MIPIVVRGIMGAAYRQDIVVDGGVQFNDSTKMLKDIRRFISTQYGDGTPTSGWTISPAPLGMWLSRVERAFDANYAPAYLMVSVLIPSGQRLKDDTILNKISRAMILNHSKYINQNVIQYECDWSFLKPLSQEIERCLVPFDGAVSNYTDPTDGEVAYYEGDLSRMMREMWSGKFTRFGTVFCGKGLLATDREYPDIKVGLGAELQNENVDGEKGVPQTTNESERSVPIEEEQSDNPIWNIIVTSSVQSESRNYKVSQDKKEERMLELRNALESKGLEVTVMRENHDSRFVYLNAGYPQWTVKVIYGSHNFFEKKVPQNELEATIYALKIECAQKGLQFDKREDLVRIVKLHFIKPNDSSINPPVYGPPVLEKSFGRLSKRNKIAGTRSSNKKNWMWIAVCGILAGLTLTMLLDYSTGFWKINLNIGAKVTAWVLWFVVYGLMMVPLVKKCQGMELNMRKWQLTALIVGFLGVVLVLMIQTTDFSVDSILACMYAVLLIPALKMENDATDIEKTWMLIGVLSSLCIVGLHIILCIEFFISDSSYTIAAFFLLALCVSSYLILPALGRNVNGKRWQSFALGLSWTMTIYTVLNMLIES